MLYRGPDTFRREHAAKILSEFLSEYFADPEVRCVRDMLSTAHLYPLGASPFLLMYLMLSTL